MPVVAVVIRAVGIQRRLSFAVKVYGIRNVVIVRYLLPLPVAAFVIYR